MLRSLRCSVWGPSGTLCRNRTQCQRQLSSTVRQKDEPLRILFCGSEGFSITALKALNEYKRSPESNILSIDVATRKDKAVGRGLKEIRSPPIKLTAAQLGLPLHQFDTFTGWHLPEYGNSSQPYINLVIAVSFGLLVPPRILKSARFGGLNVHPSMLPDLRGAAPINWTILRGRTFTGVSVQTLHPSKFDHGVILAQTPKPGVMIPQPNVITAHELRLMLAYVGADMLVHAIRSRLYLQPYTECASGHYSDSGLKMNLAPKILPYMKTLNPFEDDLVTILRKNRAIPKLWAYAAITKNKNTSKKRIIFGTTLRAATTNDLSNENAQAIVDQMPIGVPFAFIGADEDIHQSQSSLYIKVKCESILVVPGMLVAGAREKPSAAAAAHAKMFDKPRTVGSHQLYQFRQPLTTSDTDDQETEKPRASPESTSCQSGN